MNLVRWFKDARYRLFYKVTTRPAPKLVTLGAECQWTISDRDLQSTSKVLCAGAGNDISFEKELISTYGCRVVLLDPSPTGIATVHREILPADMLTFLPVGLAAKDGVFDFKEPADPLEGSFSEGAASTPGDRQSACKALSTLISELGWTEIDLLKIDIEGFEFGVLREIIEKRLMVRQICVEFHHGRSFGHRRSETARMILALRRIGYDLVHWVNWDHTFLRRDS